MSWSITTDVSSNPLVVSPIDGLIHDSIQIGAHAIGIDPRGAPRRLGNHRPMDEPPLWNRAEVGHRHPVSGDDDRLTGLHLAQNRAGIVAELSLGNRPAHGKRK